MLCVPRLANIQITQPDKKDFHTLLSMAQISGCTIKQLQLCIGSTRAIFQLLSEFHTVEKLVLVGVAASRDVLSGLVWNSGRENLVPSLQQLQVQAGKEEWRVDIVRCLLDVMFSRSSVINRRDDLPSVPLSFVKCMAEVSADLYKGYDSVFDDLKHLGENLGIQVDIKMTLEG
ncbi:hypothetical protein BDQ17DRAFT_305867 [Cyathus striatus]|nr:hypothetical protein BDQ17DRAFT_305867 [Cyathus striatus]